MALKAVELIVSGRVQKAGYRDFVTEIGRALNIVGFAENLEDGTVKIRCKGESTSIEKFKELINVKNPPEASLIEVKNMTEKQLKESDVTETAFKPKFGDMNAELLQTMSTGTSYIQHLTHRMDAGFEKLGNKIDSGFGTMDVNFQELKDKYGKISNTMDRIDKNIEKMATKKKGIFE